MVRFGIKSREWGGMHDGYFCLFLGRDVANMYHSHKGDHDGGSFMIMNIRWVDGLGLKGAEKKK